MAGSEGGPGPRAGELRADRHRRRARVLAHSRDTHVAGWPDTLQLDYRHAGMRAALLETLLGVAAQCDGVRCDMAVLLLPDVMRHSWGEPARPADAGAPVETSFWPEAIASVRARRPGFVFIPEAYGELRPGLLAALRGPKSATATGRC